MYFLFLKILQMSSSWFFICCYEDIYKRPALFVCILGSSLFVSMFSLTPTQISNLISLTSLLMFALSCKRNRSGHICLHKCVISIKTRCCFQSVTFNSSDKRKKSSLPVPSLQRKSKLSQSGPILCRVFRWIKPPSAPDVSDKPSSITLKTSFYTGCMLMPCLNRALRAFSHLLLSYNTLKWSM